MYKFLLEICFLMITKNLLKGNGNVIFPKIDDKELRLFIYKMVIKLLVKWSVQ